MTDIIVNKQNIEAGAYNAVTGLVSTVNFDFWSDGFAERTFAG